MLRLRPLLKLTGIMLLLYVCMIPLGVTIHETTHVIEAKLEGRTVYDIHILDKSSFDSGCAGYISVNKISPYGKTIQELMANICQWISYMIVYYLLVLRTSLRPVMYRLLMDASEVYGRDFSGSGVVSLA